MSRMVTGGIPLQSFCHRHRRHFAHEKDLRRHIIRTCEIVRTFHCPHCEEKFKRRNLFNDHLHNAHHILKRNCNIIADSAYIDRIPRHALGCGLCVRPFVHDQGGYANHLIQHSRNGAQLQEWNPTIQIFSLIAQSQPIVDVCISMLHSYYDPVAPAYAAMRWGAADAQASIRSLEGDTSTTSLYEHQLRIKTIVPRIIGSGYHTARLHPYETSDQVEVGQPAHFTNEVTIQSLFSTLTPRSSYHNVSGSTLFPSDRLPQSGNRALNFGSDPRAMRDNLHRPFSMQRNSDHAQLTMPFDVALSSVAASLNVALAPQLDAIRGNVSPWVTAPSGPVAIPASVQAIETPLLDAGQTIPTESSQQGDEDTSSFAFPEDDSIDSWLAEEVLTGPISELNTLNWDTTNADWTESNGSFFGFSGAMTFDPEPVSAALEGEPGPSTFRGSEALQSYSESIMLQEMGAHLQNNPSVERGLADGIASTNRHAARSRPPNG